MTDESHHKWDVILRIITAVGLTTAFFVGIWQYNENKEREYYFELWKEKKTAYVNICTAASKYIYGTDSLRFEAYNEFLQLLNGSFEILANRDVWGEAVILRAFMDSENTQFRVDQLAKLTRSANKDLLSSWNKGFKYDFDAFKKNNQNSKQKR